MEPFARLGKRVRFRPKKENNHGTHQIKRMASPTDRKAVFSILGMLSSFGLSMQRLPFYRQRGQR